MEASQEGGTVSAETNKQIFGGLGSVMRDQRAQIVALQSEVTVLRGKAAVGQKLASRLDSMLMWHHLKPQKTDEDGFDVPMHQTIEEMAACERCCKYADALVEWASLTPSHPESEEQA